MPHVKSLPAHAGPRTIFTKHPEIYRAWSEMSETLMNGPSPLSEGQREMILAFAAALGGCDFVFVAHSEVAYARGIERGLIRRLVDDFDATPVEPGLKPLLSYVRKLTLSPAELSEADAEAVFAAGWSEKALHDAIAVAARAAFMQRLVQGYGFIPMTTEEAAKRATERVAKGYVNLFPEFRATPQPTG